MDTETNTFDTKDTRRSRGLFWLQIAQKCPTVGQCEIFGKCSPIMLLLLSFLDQESDMYSDVLVF